MSAKLVVLFDKVNYTAEMHYTVVWYQTEGVS